MRVGATDVRPRSVARPDPAGEGQRAPRGQEQQRDELTSKGVPWTTALPLALLLAYADGFWITSMRGAAGAIERNQGPTVSWLRESTLGVPLYLCGVLAALVVASRLVGPVVRSGRALLTTALVLAAGGTLAGSAALVASSAYDYRLQLQLVAAGGAMPGMCSTPACLTDQQQSSFALQLHAMGAGVVLVLVTNLVVVGWFVAARGGRLDLTRIRVRGLRRLADGGSASPRRRTDDLAQLAAVGLVGSAVIHAAVVPEHLDEWRLAGLFFLGLSCVELLLSVAVVVARTTWTLATVAASSWVPLLLWVLSRGVGMPFGPDPGTPEPVGLADLACVLLETVTLVLAVVLWMRDRQPPMTPMAEPARWLAIAALLVVVALGMGGTSVAPLTVDTGDMGAMSTSGS